MKCNKTIPILRIFDYDKAVEFYVNWLGFKIDWEYPLEKNSPVYIQVSLNGLELHLSEHHGDSAPGAHVYVDCVGLKEFHKEITAKNYKYNRPGLEETFHGTWAVTVNDPFFNQITFNEERNQAKNTKIKEKT